MSDLEQQVLMAAAQAMRAALFGPIPPWLQGYPVHYTCDVVDDGDRWFDLHAGGVATVVVCETPTGELSVDADVDSGEAAKRARGGPEALRELAAELLHVADLHEQVTRQIAENA